MGVIAGGVLLCCSCWAVAGCIWYRRRGKVANFNTNVRRNGLNTGKRLGTSLFQTAPTAYSGFAMENGIWRGPQQMTLAFHPQANNTVYGNGKDHYGIFAVKGVYSARARRMSFEKIYQGASRNTRSASVRVEWNAATHAFEGQSIATIGGARQTQRFSMYLQDPKRGQP